MGKLKRVRMRIRPDLGQLPLTSEVYYDSRNFTHRQ
jgi:hypothetical protein